MTGASNNTPARSARMVSSWAPGVPGMVYPEELLPIYDAYTTDRPT